MNNYIISYNLPYGGDYSVFHKEIKTYNSFHLLESVWLMSTPSCADTVKNWVERLLGNGVKVAVIQIDNDYSISNSIPQKADLWLKTRI